MADRAQYICVATNEFGSINTHASVEVFEKPTIVRRPRDQVFNITKPFECKYSIKSS